MNRKLSDAQHAQIEAMRRRGYGVALIAAEVGCSRGAVDWHCLSRGIDPPKTGSHWAGIRGPSVARRGGHLIRRFGADEDARLLALEGQGLTYAAIARQLRRNPTSVAARLMTLARREERALTTVPTRSTAHVHA